MIAGMSTEQPADEKSIRYVLFVCNHNAGRSQRAQAFFERYGAEDVRAEFGSVNPPDEIRACAEAVLATFSGARIRSHVLALAYRQARDCLRRETCDLIATGETP
jgi:protein-tyrosine-phosphatase